MFHSLRTASPLIAIAIIGGILAAIAIPNLMMSARKAKDYRIAGDTKHAVTQAIMYAKDKGVYPTSITVLREEGYTALSDKDHPRGNEWVPSPVLTRGGIPREGDNVYVFSRGKGTGVYPQPFTTEIGHNE